MAKPIRSTTLNPRQQAFLRFYLGRDPDYRGNATQSYKRAYSVEDDRIAQNGGSRLINHPLIRSKIEQAEQAAIKKAGIDAQFVLDQSLRLYDLAVGDLPVETSIKEIDEHGQERTKLRQVRGFDPKAAQQALRMIGDNKHVQAFQQNVEVSHTHYLEQRLAARTKAIEGRAQVVDTRPELANQVEALPAGNGGNNGDNAAQVADLSDQSHGAALAIKRGSIRADVKKEERAREEKTSSHSEGATADEYIHHSTQAAQ